MTNHPNRGPKGPQSNPTTAEIIAARQAAGMTQTEAAALIGASLGAWQKWEIDGPQGRRMHPAMWELFRIKVRAAGSEKAFAAWWGEGGDDLDFGIASDAWRAAVAWIMGAAN